MNRANKVLNKVQNNLKKIQTIKNKVLISQKSSLKKIQKMQKNTKKEEQITLKENYKKIQKKCNKNLLRLMKKKLRHSRDLKK